MISTIYSHRSFFELPDVRKNFAALVELKSQNKGKKTILFFRALSFRLKIEISTKTNSAIAFFSVETFLWVEKPRATCSTNKRENRRQSRAFPALCISYFIDWVVIGKSDCLQRFWVDESHFECTTHSWNCLIYQINTDKVWGNFNSLFEVLINLSCSPF